MISGNIMINRACHPAWKTGAAPRLRHQRRAAMTLGWGARVCFSPAKWTLSIDLVQIVRRATDFST